MTKRANLRRQAIVLGYTALLPVASMAAATIAAAAIGAANAAYRQAPRRPGISDQAMRTT